MDFKSFGKKVRKILLIMIAALLVLFVPVAQSVTYASHRTVRSRSTKGGKHSHKSRKGKSSTSKKSKKGKQGKKSKRCGKGKHTRHGRKSAKYGRRHRRRRGRAVYVSCAESPSQRKHIAEMSIKLEANPDLSGNVPELSQDSYVWPIHYGYISRGVGRGHSGLDMMSRAGEAVYAVADGKVTFVSVNNSKYRGYGKMCIISHPSKGTSSLYSHCSAIYVRVGQRVQRGQKIATVGRTGLTTTNHLHFEMKKNGRRINPERVLPRTGALGHKYVPH